MPDYVALNASQLVSESDPFTVRRYGQFANWLNPDAVDILDIGCNTGRGGAALKALRPNLKIVGLDIVQERLDRLPRDVYSRTVCGSATRIPMDDESVDAVVAGEFVEHIPSASLMDFFNESFRVLRMNGLLMITTPNPLDIKMWLRGGTNLGGSHVSQHVPQVLKLQMHMASFSSVKLRGTGKVSSILGTRFPWLALYGSYLAVGRKH